jgi:hypothetical protein
MEQSFQAWSRMTRAPFATKDLDGCGSTATCSQDGRIPRTCWSRSQRNAHASHAASYDVIPYEAISGRLRWLRFLTCDELVEILGFPSRDIGAR